MPKKLERKLEREASEKHLTGRRRGAYIYGTLAKIKRKHAASRAARTQRIGGRKRG